MMEHEWVSERMGSESDIGFEWYHINTQFYFYKHYSDKIDVVQSLHSVILLIVSSVTVRAIP